jgi:hypothetical protein
MKKKPTKGCLICGGEAEIHHIRDGQGTGQRASHFDVLPLCHIHHRTGKKGVAFHAGPREWQAKFGKERDLLIDVLRRVQIHRNIFGDIIH